ncbi:MAG: MBOAT family protein, partial [Planctomycetes bacterium]|nr:MBOAT family protein [Planctomycetota bacterium]
YAWPGWPYLGLIVFSTAVDWQCGARIGACPDKPRRRRLLLVSVAVNLGLLGFFKYRGLVLELVNEALSWVGGPQWAPWLPGLALPVGISFYTFQSLSYTIDVYRGTVAAAPLSRPLRFFAYVALFPQLVAGPIVRYHQLVEQLQDRRIGLDMAAHGAFFFMIGFAKKTLLANQLGVFAAALFEGQDARFLEAWVGLLSYSLQIYYDFSGYSDMAIGLGLLLGLRLPINFNSPYRSRSITEFWQRWHITLSSFLRDYLYIPLGGNRGGRIRTARNLMVTMVLGGLWHGAAWTYVLWGAWHGLWLGIERLIGRRSIGFFLPRPLQCAFTFLVVTLGWLLFESHSVAQAWQFTHTLFVPTDFAFLLGAPHDPRLGFLVLGMGLALVFFAPNTQTFAQRIGLGRALFALVVFALGIEQVLQHGFNPFIYYRF